MTPKELAVALGCGDLKVGGSLKVSSPLRDDDNPSLNVTLKPGGIWAFKDFGDNRPQKEVYADLVAWAEGNRNGTPTPDENKRWHEVARYMIRDAEGTLVGQKVRLEDDEGNKSFRWRHADGTTGEPPEAKGVFYGADRLAQAPRDQEFILANGEKAVDRAWDDGILAVCSTAGEGTPLHPREVADAASRPCLCVIDRDDPGTKRARHLLTALSPVCPKLRFAQSATMGAKDDLFDHLEAGYAVDDLAPYSPKVTRSVGLLEFWETHKDPPTWVIPDLIAEGDVVGIVAPPKNMKTYTVLHLIYCLASRAPVFEQGRYQPTRPFKVMLVEEEGNAHLLGQRLHRVSRYYGDDWKEMPRIEHKEGFTLENPTMVEELISEIEEHGIEVLVLDPWQRMTGGRDESSSSDTQVLWNTIFYIQQRTGVTILVVHHSRKDAELNQNMIRGSSRFMGEIDTVMLLRKGDDNTLEVVIEGRESEGTDGQKKILRVYWEDDDHNDVFRLDGTEFTETVSVKMKKARSQVPDAIAAILTREWIDTKTLVAAVNDYLGTKKSRQAITTHLDKMVAEKQVAVKQTLNGRTRTNVYQKVAE